MRAQKDKLYKTLKYYKEAVGEQPSGELHPDLAGSQENYEDEAERTQAMETAEVFFNKLFEEVNNLVQAAVEEYIDNASALESAALDILIEDMSPAGPRDPDFDEAGLSEMMWKALKNLGA